MRAWIVIAIIAVSLFIAYPVRAGGFELLPGGTRAVGRGGAVAARAEDPMALLHNPAGLALISEHQVLLNSDITLHDMCVDPYGYYGWGVYESGESEFGDATADPYATDPMDQICNSAPVFPIPQLVWAGRLNDKLGVGAGFVTYTALPGFQFGGEDGTINTPDGGRPTPTRYQMIKQEVVFGLDPTVGIGYRVLRELRVGLSLQALMAKVDAWMVQSYGAGTSPHDDMLVKLKTEDFFVPVLNFSVHATPIKSVDLMLGFRWVDDFSGPGSVTHTTRTYQQGSDTYTPFKNDPIRLKKVTVPFPWALTFGARYAGLRRQRRTEEEKWHRARDPMMRELWDLELDVTYSFNARASDNSIEFAREEAELEFHRVGEESNIVTIEEGDISQFNMDRHLRDSIAIRLGGSYAFIPRIAAINAGTFFESRGVDPDYANIDLFAFQRIGLGVGLTTRMGYFEFVSAYSHIFQEDLEVAPPEHQSRFDATDDPASGFDQRVGGVASENDGVLLPDPDAPSPSQADATARLQQSAVIASSSEGMPRRVVNAGRYTGNYNVISLGLTYRF